MIVYPSVLDETATLQRVLDGASLARYGDGEFALCDGHEIPCQHFDSMLQRRLLDILVEAGPCLVGIPNLQSATPKAPFWRKYAGHARLLANRPYVSAFVSRPDSAPWIDTPTYWAGVQSLWLNQDVTLVRGSARSLIASDLGGAGMVTEIVAPTQHAWNDYEALLDRIGCPARALLCLGPTATVLAVDLCARGVHAVDLGHIGMFMRKLRIGLSMQLTQADKQAIA